MYVHTAANIYTHMHVCTLKTHTYMRVHVYKHARTYTQIYIRKCTHVSSTRQQQ